MKGESIYRYIIKMSEGNPGLPYPFQNPLAGREDVTNVIWGDRIPSPIKEKWARELLELIIPCLGSQSPSAELIRALNDRPIYLFLHDLSSRISLLLEEELIDAEKLYAFGIHLATCGERESEVKLGIILLGKFENDMVSRILRTLGLHSTLTIYALEAAGNFKHRNQFTFDLARHTTGYGKFACLYMLVPIKPEQKEWVFTQGAINYIAVNLSSILCLEKVDMADFYFKLVLTEGSFPKLSYLLAHALEHSNVVDCTPGPMLVEKYLEVATVFARSFIDLAALIVIKRGLPFTEPSESGDPPSPKMVALQELCNGIIFQNRWKSIVGMELIRPRQQTSLVLLVLHELGMVPDFPELLSLLQRDPFDMDILKHLLVEHPKEYLDEVFDYLQAVLPDDVWAENPQAIEGEKFSLENKPDVWLVYLLKALRREKRYKEGLLIQGLTCRFPDVRTESARGLQDAISQWSKHVIPALEHACALEPVQENKDRLQRILGKARGEDTVEGTED